MKDLKKQHKFIPAFFCLFLAVLFISQNNFLRGDISQKEVSLNACDFPLGKKRIAACPTFHRHLKILDQEKFDFYLTGSTAESLDLLENHKVDIVLAGRTLMPYEKESANKMAGDNDKYYSFLSKDTRTIYSERFDLYDFYTDLPEDEIRRDLNIERVRRVGEVYEYLDKGIIITSWNNTNFNKANIVHVLNQDGSRLELSRIPIIYYRNECDLNLIGEIEESIINS